VNCGAALGDLFQVARRYQSLLGMLTGAGVVGGFISAAGYRNDAIASRLEEKMTSLEGKLGEKVNRLDCKLGEKVNRLEDKLASEMGSLEGKVNATMAGVLSGSADKAKAATLEVLKAYKISVAGAASKSP